MSASIPNMDMPTKPGSRNSNGSGPDSTRVSSRRMKRALQDQSELEITSTFSRKTRTMNRTNAISMPKDKTSQLTANTRRQSSLADKSRMITRRQFNSTQLGERDFRQLDNATQGLRMTNDNAPNARSLRPLRTTAGLQGALSRSLEQLTAGSQQQVTFDKVLRLLKDKHASKEEFFERHAVAVQKIIDARRNGILVREAVSLAELVQQCQEIMMQAEIFLRTHEEQQVVQKQPQYGLPDTAAAEEQARQRRIYQQRYDTFTQFLLRLLDICSLPLVFDKTTDELMRVDSLRTVVNACGGVLTIPFEKAIEVKTSAAKCLLNIMQRQADDDIIEEVIGKSSLAHATANELGLLSSQNEPDMGYMRQLIMLIRDLSLMKQCAIDFVEHGGIDTAIKFVGQLDITTEELPMFLDVMWNAFENYPRSKEILGGSFSIQTIHTIITTLLEQGYRQRDREIVNDLLVLVGYIAEIEENQKRFLTTGFTATLCHYSLQAEIDYLNGVTQRMSDQFLSKTDFERKRLMWHIIFLLSFDDDCLEVFLDNGLLAVILRYLDASKIEDSDFLKASMWSQSQIRELQKQILELLFVLSVRIPEDFTQAGTCDKVLHFIQLCEDEVLQCLSVEVLMNSATTMQGAKILMNEDAFKKILQLIVDPFSPIDAREDGLQVMSNLCSIYPENRTVFAKCQGVQRMVELLNADKNNPTSSDEFIFSLVDCIWSCVVNSKTNAQEFIQHDGLFVFFNVFERVADYVKFTMLGCLADFCQNYPHEIATDFRDWRSETSKKTMPKLLVDLWTESESFEKRIADVRARAATDPTAAVEKARLERNQAFGICRADMDFKIKIYHVLRLVGFDDMPGLSNTDNAVLVRIKEHDKILRTNVFRQIEQELIDQGVRPITPDMQMLQEQASKQRNTVDAVGKKQQEYAQRETEQQLEDEKRFFETLDERRKPPPKMLRGMSIMEIKLRKAQMLQNSLKSDQLGAVEEAGNKAQQQRQRQEPSTNQTDHKYLEYDEMDGGNMYEDESDLLHSQVLEDAENHDEDEDEIEDVDPAEYNYIDEDEEEEEEY